MEKNNNKALLVGTILIALVAVLTFLRPVLDRRDDESENTGAVVAEEPYAFISISDFEKQKDQYVIFDSRPAEAFRQEHLVSSFNVSIDKIDEYLPRVGAGQKIIIVGADSADLSAKQLAQVLAEKKVENFSILSGGIASWSASGGQTFRLGNPSSLSDQAKIDILKPEDLKNALDSQDPQFFILDLRSSGQYATGHLPRAKNIPASELEEKFRSIPSGKIIVYYAEDELESFQLGVALFELGFHGGSALEGGIEAWKAKGFPVEK